jgi:DNA-binding transcriptional MerR regulator
MGDEQSVHSNAVQTNRVYRDGASPASADDPARAEVSQTSGSAHPIDQSIDNPAGREMDGQRPENSLRENGTSENGRPHMPRAAWSRAAQTAQPNDKASDYTFIEVANLLNVSPDTLRRLSLRFADYLSEGANEDDEPTYTRADVVALSSVQKLLAQGYDDEQIGDFLTIPSGTGSSGIGSSGVIPFGSPGEVEPSLHSIVAYPAERRSRESAEAGSTVSKTVNEILATISGSQQAVLNSQSTVREVVGVLVQDNFNLKDENRKLRERMLEVERSLAEYQRREETRKERLDGRLRALEGTMAALQQQVAQLVQIQRQQRKRRGWFG